MMIHVVQQAAKRTKRTALVKSARRQSGILMPKVLPVANAWSFYLVTKEDLLQKLKLVRL